MTLKLNKQIKTHIADMAIRKKYKAKFTELLKTVTDKACSELYDKYHNEDFDVLPDRAKRLIKTARGVSLRNTIYMGSRIYGYNKEETGYLLATAFQVRNDFSRFDLPKEVYASRDYRGDASLPDSCEPLLSDLTTFLKEASAARQTLLDAMAHYKSCKKMFAELPWTEEFYPESEKKPACNVVPVSTIATANELMGL